MSGTIPPPATTFPISHPPLPVTGTTTQPPAPSIPNNTGVVVVMGYSETSDGYKKLNDTVQQFWGQRLGANVPLLVTDWRQGMTGICSLIKTRFGSTRPIVMVGFSFGGGVSAPAAELIPNPIKRLVLLDPVDPKRSDRANTVGLSVPPNVQAATCFYRGAKTSPWSTSINNIRPGLQNIRYVPVSNNPHGEKVWSGDTIQLVKNSL